MLEISSYFTGNPERQEEEVEDLKQKAKRVANIYTNKGISLMRIGQWERRRKIPLKRQEVKEQEEEEEKTFQEKEIAALLKIAIRK